MAGWTDRLRRWRDQPVEPQPGHWSDALTVAYQQGLGWLHELAEEAEAIAAQRRRLAVGPDDPRVRPELEARDAALAIQQRQVRATREALRGHLEQLRTERDLILALPDPQTAARRARDVLDAWRAEPDRLVRQADAEPGGYVAETEPGPGFEQPDWGRP